MAAAIRIRGSGRDIIRSCTHMVWLLSPWLCPQTWTLLEFSLRGGKWLLLLNKNVHLIQLNISSCQHEVPQSNFTVCPFGLAQVISCFESQQTSISLSLSGDDNRLCFCYHYLSLFISLLFLSDWFSFSSSPLPLNLFPLPPLPSSSPWAQFVLLFLVLSGG